MRGGRVEAYIGRFGAGKTYSMVCNAYQARVAEGIPVAANFELLGDVWGDWVRISNWQELVQLEGCLVLLDEAGLWFDNRNYRTFPPELAAWITQMRHLDCWFWYTVQHESSVDAKLRRNTATYWSHQRFGPWILQKGFEPLTGEKFQTKWHRLKPSRFALYDTKEVLGNANGEGTQIGGNRLRPSSTDKALIRRAMRSLTRIDDFVYGNRVQYRRASAQDLVDGLDVYPVRSDYEIVES